MHNILTPVCLAGKIEIPSAFSIGIAIRNYSQDLNLINQVNSLAIDSSCLELRGARIPYFLDPDPIRNLDFNIRFETDS